MIIKVNTLGLSIDVSASAALTEQFGTTKATLANGFIAKIRIAEANEVTEHIQIVDKHGDEYDSHFSVITSINGVSGFTSNTEAFNAINDALFGF